VRLRVREVRQAAHDGQRTRPPGPQLPLDVVVRADPRVHLALDWTALRRVVVDRRVVRLVVGRDGRHLPGGLRTCAGLADDHASEAEKASPVPVDGRILVVVGPRDLGGGIEVARVIPRPSDAPLHALGDPQRGPKGRARPRRLGQRRRRLRLVLERGRRPHAVDDTLDPSDAFVPLDALAVRPERERVCVLDRPREDQARSPTGLSPHQDPHAGPGRHVLPPRVIVVVSRPAVGARQGVGLERAAGIDLELCPPRPWARGRHQEIRPPIVLEVVGHRPHEVEPELRVRVALEAQCVGSPDIPCTRIVVDRNHCIVRQVVRSPAEGN
jgi:hypothetical protein